LGIIPKDHAFTSGPRDLASIAPNRDATLRAWIASIFNLTHYRHFGLGFRLDPVLEIDFVKRPQVIEISNT